MGKYSLLLRSKSILTNIHFIQVIRCSSIYGDMLTLNNYSHNSYTIILTCQYLKYLRHTLPQSAKAKVHSSLFMQIYITVHTINTIQYYHHGALVNPCYSRLSLSKPSHGNNFYLPTGSGTKVWVKCQKASNCIRGKYIIITINIAPSFLT